MTEQEYQHALDNCLSARKAAYQQESDGLYFSAMLENTSLADWIAKIHEIKERYPKPGHGNIEEVGSV
jgi:hypothetical protein